jgi:transcriptional regulator with XRE-family HTH domain
MTVGLQKLCEKKNVSMLTLADRSGLDLLRLQAIYQGRWTPSPAERRRIAEALEASPDEIAWGHEIQVEHFYGPG